jgi:aryl-alcohol dehydrogenase
MVTERKIAMLNIVKPETRDTIVIVGAGNVGLAALMAVKISGAKPEKVICVDVKNERLAMAKKYGATHLINSIERPDLAKELFALTDNLGVDAVIDTSGRPAVLKECLNAAARKGVVVSVGVGVVSSFHNLFLTAMLF